MIPDAFLLFLETSVLASTWHPLRGLPTAQSRVRLVRPGAREATAPLGVVLLDRLPSVLVALSKEIAGRG